MPTKCAVKSCKNTSENATYQMGITHHRFPQDPEMMQRWIDVTGNDPEWWPGRHDTMCSVHFEEKCFRKLKNNQRLFVWAVPTLKLTPDNGELTETNESSTSKVKPQIAEKQSTKSPEPLKSPEPPKPPEPIKPSEPVNQSRKSTPVVNKTTQTTQKMKCINHVMETKKVCCNCKMISNADFDTEISKVEGPTKLIVAKVYHFLEQEFEELNERYGDSVNLAPLAKLRSRTADATGVGRSTITKILNEEKQWKNEKREQCKVGKLKRKADAEMKRIRKRRRNTGGSSSDDDSSDESDNEKLICKLRKQKTTKVDTGTETNGTFVEENDNNNNGSAIEENNAAPMQVITEQEYYTPVNYSVQNNEGIVTLAPEPIEFEFHNIESDGAGAHIATQPLVATEHQYCVDPSMSTIAIAQSNDTLQTDSYITEQQYCGVDVNQETYIDVNPSMNATITIAQPNDTLQTEPYITEHQYCSVDVDPSMTNTIVTIGQPTIICQTEPVVTEQYCSSIVQPVMTDEQYCSDVVEPAMTDEQYCSNVVEPAMTDEQYCSNVVEPAMTDEQYCSNVVEPAMTDEQYCSNVVEPAMTDEQYCSNVVEPAMTDEQYCSNVVEEAMTDEQYCSNVVEETMTDEQYCSNVVEEAMTDEQYCSNVVDEAMTEEQYCNNVDEPVTDEQYGEDPSMDDTVTLSQPTVACQTELMIEQQYSGMTDEEYSNSEVEPNMTNAQYCSNEVETNMTDEQYCSGEEIELQETDEQYCSGEEIEPQMTDEQYIGGNVDVEPTINNTITISQPTIALHAQELIAEPQYIGNRTGDAVNFTDGVNFYVIM